MKLINDEKKRTILQSSRIQLLLLRSSSTMLYWIPTVIGEMSQIVNKIKVENNN